MQHPYLNLTKSDTYSDKYVVGKTKFVSGGNGNGLIDKSVKIIEIPSSFNGIEIVEIGYNSFTQTAITSVFVPKTVLHICASAFSQCAQLTDVRFEEGSKLEKFGQFVFFYCALLKKIDFPASVTNIADVSNFNFFHSVSLDCFSYSGIHDFSSLKYFFNSVQDVYVSNSYPSDKFAGKTVSKGPKTCGVSKEHLEEPNYGTSSGGTGSNGTSSGKTKNPYTCECKYNFRNNILL